MRHPKRSHKKVGLSLLPLLAAVPSLAPTTVFAQALEEESFAREELIHVIHKLHGSSSYCGVPRLKSLCATLEQALQEKLAKVSAQEWSSLNRNAIKSYNDFIEEHGSFGEEFKQF